MIRATKDYTNKLLQWGFANDRISPSEVLEVGMETSMKTLLDDIHKYDITQIASGRCKGQWQTFVPDPMKPNGRRQIRRKSQTDLFAALFDFYGIAKEASQGSMTFKELFDEFCNYKLSFVNVKNSRKSKSPLTVSAYSYY